MRGGSVLAMQCDSVYNEIRTMLFRYYAAVLHFSHGDAIETFIILHELQVLNCGGMKFESHGN